MKQHRGTLFVVAPILLVLFLLSLPVHVNLSLRNSIGNSFSSFWKLMHSMKKQSITAEKRGEIERFFAHRLAVKEEALFHAKKFLQEKSFANAPSKVLVGQVLYRSVHTWNSSLWIDLGEEDNPKGAECAPLIAKNSPVLSGNAVIGVVDYVGKKTSLVRLITDAELVVAVRVQRENVENKSIFLAKGEIRGHGAPLWRTPGQFLHGVGFNYDFKDTQGPAYDLRTGEPIDPEGEYTTRERMSLIQVDDILVTSGMDGMFPEGLKVAKVHSILPLREGAYYYELLATPIASDLLDLQSVIVLPPQGFSMSDIPSNVERLLKEIPITSSQ